MKVTFFVASLFLGSSVFATEADSTGLTGDHLDLQAVMEAFKVAESPEDFEKRLNTENAHINNLDLDENGEVDYIRVIDAGDKVSHVLTLQVAVNEHESQDIATIELEETSKDVVEIQIVGDEDLYGANYIIVPESAGKSPAIVNVIMWPSVRFMWAPGYRLWVSPWRYRSYPAWFRPWKRRSWRVFHGYNIRHHRYYRRIYKRAFTHAHIHHYHRTHSPSFHKKQGYKSVGAKSNAPKVQPSPKTSNQKKQNAKVNQQKATKKKTTSPARKRPGTRTTKPKGGNSGRSSRGGRKN